MDLVKHAGITREAVADVSKSSSAVRPVKPLTSVRLRPVDVLARLGAYMDAPVEGFRWALGFFNELQQGTSTDPLAACVIEQVLRTRRQVARSAARYYARTRSEHAR